jgi:acetoin utilization deacetylase AcuC-like enzyme
MTIGLVLDPLFQKHDPGAYHVETPHRLISIARAINHWPFGSMLEKMSPRPATTEELTLVHRPRHLENLAATAGRVMALDPDTSTSPESFDVALKAAGSLIDLCDAALDGKVEHGLALVRPPGHHATPDRSMGFCLFNNVAVAAAHLTQVRGLERVLIVDWDVHHGNGTEQMFFADPKVFYFSVHQYPFYPGTGALEAVGQGEAKGRNLNVPLRAGKDDLDYVRIFLEVLQPVALAFNPEFILVSAGFDTHLEDPLGGMKLTDRGYVGMTHVLLDLAKRCCPGRVVMTLEGGYAPQAMADSIVAVLETMGDLRDRRMLEHAMDKQACHELLAAREMAGQFWDLA